MGENSILNRQKGGLYLTASSGHLRQQLLIFLAKHLKWDKSPRRRHDNDDDQLIYAPEVGTACISSNCISVRHRYVTRQSIKWFPWCVVWLKHANPSYWSVSQLQYKTIKRKQQFQNNKLKIREKKDQQCQTEMINREIWQTELISFHRFIATCVSRSFLVQRSKWRSVSWTGWKVDVDGI